MTLIVTIHHTAVAFSGSGQKKKGSQLCHEERNVGGAAGATESRTSSTGCHAVSNIQRKGV